MKKQLPKINLVNTLKTINAIVPGKTALFFLLLFVTGNTMARARMLVSYKEPPPFFSTVTSNPAALFFSTIEGKSAEPKNLVITISGVSASAQTFVEAPLNFQLLNSKDGAPLTHITLNGNATFVFFVTGFNRNPGFFEGDIKISGSEVSTQFVALSLSVSPNPSIFPSALNFSTVEGQPSLTQELTITISNVSANAQTLVEAPDFYQLLETPTGSPFKKFLFIGSGVLKLLVRFSSSFNPGNFNAELIISGDEITSKKIPLKTVNLPVPTPVANPASLSGFTAIVGGNPSAIQSFDLSVKGLPTQGKPVVTVSAPKGYSVGLSSNPSSFVGAFIVFANNGNISSKVFVRLNSNNPVGALKGNITITGTEAVTKNVPVNGTITAKPLPTLTIDKTSLTGFTTTTNKPSITQSYKLAATNLDAGVTVTIKAPTGYEISLNSTANAIFSAQLTLSNTAGSINSTIFVRLKSQFTAGTITGTLQNTVAGITKNITLSGTVVLPPSVVINPLSITGFNTVKNEASISKTYSFVASNLTAGLTATITAPVNYELRIQNTGSFAGSLVLSQNGTGSINRIIEVRLKAIATTGTISGSIQNVVAGITKLVSVTGTVAAPVLSVTTSSLTFTTVKNQASATKIYKVVASGLATGLTATVTASTGYEISFANAGTFSSSLTLAQNIAHGISTDIFVRLKATATTGAITGSILHSAAGLSKTISLSASVAAPVLTINPVSLTGFSTTPNVASIAKTYSIVASGLATGLTATVTAPVGYEISVQGTNIFSGSLSLAQTSANVISRTILVRLKAQAANSNIAGNITNTVAGLTKTVAVSGTVKTLTALVSQDFSTLKTSVGDYLEAGAWTINTYPNPVADQLTVDFGPLMDSPVLLRLFDLHGTTLVKQELSQGKGTRQLKLSLAGQKSGLYLLEIISGTRHKTIKIMKQ